MVNSGDIKLDHIFVDTYVKMAYVYNEVDVESWNQLLP